jgi:hypothetical protein
MMLHRSRRHTGAIYLGALATPIERAAISYQGLDLNETLLHTLAGHTNDQRKCVPAVPDGNG